MKGDEIWQDGKSGWVAGPRSPFGELWPTGQSGQKVKKIGKARVVDRLRDQSEILQDGGEVPAAGLRQVWHHQI